jgi:hypothetical protein
MTVPRDINRILLPNALHLVCREDSRRYFGDYHLVRILMSVSVPLEPRFFDDGDECRAARKLLPDPVVYRCVSERMGVSSADVDAVRTALVHDLLRHAGGYLGSSQFPRKFIRAELSRIRSGGEINRSVPVLRGA